MFGCLLLHCLSFGNADQWYEPSCSGIWHFFLPICQAFRRVGRKAWDNDFPLFKINWGLPAHKHYQGTRRQLSIPSWKHGKMHPRLLTQTFLWGWMPLRIFPLSLLDMPLEDVSSSHPALQQFSLSFPDYSRSWGSYWRNVQYVASGASLTSLSARLGSVARGTCLKLHSVILLPHKMWRQGPACGLTVPAMRKGRIRAEDFGSWLAPLSTFGEAGKIGPVGAHRRKVVPTPTNPLLRMICRAFEFHRQIKGCRDLSLQHFSVHENQHKCRCFIPNP